MALADQFLQYGQLRSQNSQQLGQDIGGAIDLYTQIMQRKEANLAAAREKELLRQEAARKASMEPQAIAAKAMQFGPQSLTPEERATFDAYQQLEAAQVGVDQYGNTYQKYAPIVLGQTGAQGPSATPVVAQTPMTQPSMQSPQASAAASAIGLLPPRIDGGEDSVSAFELLGPPTPIGESSIKTPKAEPISISKTAEDRLKASGITRPTKPARMDTATEEAYKSELRTYEDALKAEREAVFEEQKTGKQAEKDVGRVEDKANMVIKTIDSILTDKALDTSVGGFAGLRGMSTSKLPITEGQRRIAPKIKQLQGQTFLQAFEALKGGGQITQVEGDKAQAAIAALDTTQSPEDFRRALNDLKAIVQTGLSRAKGSVPSNVPAAAVDMLMSNPGLSSQFNAKYGAGAAERILNGGQ